MKEHQLNGLSIGDWITDTYSNKPAFFSKRQLVNMNEYIDIWQLNSEGVFCKKMLCKNSFLEQFARKSKKDRIVKVKFKYL